LHGPLALWKACGITDAGNYTFGNTDVKKLTTQGFLDSKTLNSNQLGNSLAINISLSEAPSTIFQFRVLHISGSWPFDLLLSRRPPIAPN
jgi:hypothetical protein